MTSKEKAKRLCQSAADGDENGVWDALKCGVEVNCNKNILSRPAISYAAANGKTSIVRLLIQEGAQVDLHDRNGWSSLHHAASNGSIESFQLLLEAGAHINQREHSGRTPFALAVESGNESVVKFLIRRNSDIMLPTNTGESPVHLACGRGDLSMVKLLSQVKGVNMEAVDEFQRRPFHYAALKGHGNVCLYLMHHVNVDRAVVDADGWTALHWATANGKEEVITLLMEAGLDATKVSKEGVTCLHLAARHGLADAARQMLKEGADKFSVDKDGKLAIQYAQERGFDDIVELLQGWPYRSKEDHKLIYNLENEVKILTEQVTMLSNEESRAQEIIKERDVAFARAREVELNFEECIRNHKREMEAAKQLAYKESSELQEHIDMLKTEMKKRGMALMNDETSQPTVINDLKKKLQQAHAGKSEAEKMLEEQKRSFFSQRSKYEEEISSLEKMVRDSRRSSVSASRKLNELEAEVERAKEKLCRAIEKESTAWNRVKELETMVRELSESLEAAKKETRQIRGDMKEEMLGLKTKNKRLSQTVVDTEDMVMRIASLESTNSSLSVMLHDCEEEVRATQSKLETCFATIEALSAEKNELEKSVIELDKLRHCKEASESEGIKLRAEIAKFTRELEVSQKACLMKDVRIRECEEEIARIRMALESKAEHNAEILENLKTTKDTLENCKEDFGSLQSTLEDKEKEMAGLRMDLEVCNRQLQEVTESFDRQRESLHDVNVELLKETEKITTKNNELERVKVELVDAISEISSRKKQELMDRKKLNETQDELSECQMEVADLQRKCLERDKVIYDLESRLSQQSDVNRTAQERIDSFEKELSMVTERGAQMVSDLECRQKVEASAAEDEIRRWKTRFNETRALLDEEKMAVERLNKLLDDAKKDKVCFEKDIANLKSSLEKAAEVEANLNQKIGETDQKLQIEIGRLTHELKCAREDNARAEKFIEQANNSYARTKQFIVDVTLTMTQEYERDFNRKVAERLDKQLASLDAVQNSVPRLLALLNESKGRERILRQQVEEITAKSHKFFQDYCAIKMQLQVVQKQVKGYQEEKNELLEELGLIQSQERESLDNAMHSLKGATITCDRVGAKTLESLLVKLEGKKNSGGDYAGMFKTAFLVVKREVIAVAGEQKSGEEWNLNKDSITRMPGFTLKNVYKALQELVVAYDNMDESFKNDSTTGRELVENVKTLLSICRYSRAATSRTPQSSKKAAGDSASSRNATPRAGNGTGTGPQKTAWGTVSAPGSPFAKATTTQRTGQTLTSRTLRSPSLTTRNVKHK